jgi:glycerol-3-phosphate acyltransferase PlsY|tara:strand:- start:2448 stop:3047 length:600 start_codon:yes stop_codon:yes gene_type:complete
MPFIDSIEVLLLGYFLGSFPSGLVFSKISGGNDIRKTGSGNIGATNVLRTGSKLLALLTLISDLGKGFLTIKIANLINPEIDIASIAALGCIMGHIFPIWTKFKGGKGVATAIGVLLALAWKVAIAIIIIWFFVAIITKYSSLAALITFTTLPFLAAALETEFQPLALCIMVIIWITHKKNIQRLLKKEETKINLRKNK